jgi:hypothetical protein
MKFEKFFEQYLEHKYVDKKMEKSPPLKIEFDTTTKPEGTFNAKVNK